jgi:hypothetical protein
MLLEDLVEMVLDLQKTVVLLPGILDLSMLDRLMTIKEMMKTTRVAMIVMVEDTTFIDTTDMMTNEDGSTRYNYQPSRTYYREHTDHDSP